MIVDPDDLIEFARTIEGELLTTLSGSSTFTVAVTEKKGIDYTPDSTGKPRHQTYNYTKRVCEQFSETQSLRRSEYGFTAHGSYVLALIDLYIKTFEEQKSSDQKFFSLTAPELPVIFYPAVRKTTTEAKPASDRNKLTFGTKTKERKMRTLTCSAVCGTQKGRRIYTGILPAGDLIDITTVDHYNSSKSPDDPKQGYQRPPERSRITRIGTYLIKNIVEDDDAHGSGLFPTAVTLAARSPLTYDPDTKELTLHYDQKLQVVDGQHRIEGLRYAIREKEELYLKDFPIPFVIMETPDRIVEMNQFRTINGTAKSVRTDLVNSILTAIAASQGDTYISDKDKWRVVVTRVIDRLDKDEESPWHNLILMPDEAGSPKGSDGKVVRATSFMTSLKPVHDWLEYFNFLRDADDLAGKADTVYDLVAPYWEAIQTVVPEAFENPSTYVIQKTPGLFSLHKLLVADLVPHMFRNRIDWTWNNFVKLIEDSPELTDADFWHKSSGRASSYGSMKGFQELYELLRNSIELGN